MSSSDNAGAVDPQTGHTGNAHTGKDFERAPEHAHDRVDAKDERSHANTVKDALRVEKLEEKADAEHKVVDPTAAARAHGNEPSRGAKKDLEILEDEEEELERKRMSDEAKAANKKH